jgi:alpha-galactosidase
MGMMAHAHTNWLSDEVRPKPSVQLAYGCTVEFTPGICNHWMVGDTDQGEVYKSDDPGWWDFMFRVPMNGQFGISSRVFDWSPELLEHARENVALYKRLRNIIVSADTFHLTPPPAHENPTGWMAIQYVEPGSARSIVMAYRLGESEADQTFKLRGLKADTAYQAKAGQKVLGEWRGETLMESGLALRLDTPWRAQVIELDAAN